MVILVPDSIYEELVAPASVVAPNVRLAPYEEDAGSAPEGLNEAEAVLRWVGGGRFAGLVADGPRVRWLHTASAGVDHVLTAPVRAKAEGAGLIVTDSGPAFAICIGEFVLAWMLMVAHRLPDLIERQRAHEWRGVTQEELHGQTVGVIGLGPIGHGIAERCGAMGMRVLGLRRRAEPVASVDEVLTGPDGLRRLLGESNWVVIAAALTGETRALIGAEQIALMKPTARIVNIARGPLVDEAALIAALQEKRIAGACLDVFEKEPLSGDSPLWNLPNVYIAPHNSPGWTTALRTRQRQLFLDNLARFARGEELMGVVDIAQGY